MADARASSMPIKFMAGPAQLRFIQSRAMADLFCGRMREGKTAALIWACWHHCRMNPDANWILLRNTWTNFQRTTMEEFRKWFPFGVAGMYKASEKKFTWKMGEMRGNVYFMGLDDQRDVGNLQSMTIAGFGIDEVAPALGEDGIESGGVDELVFDMAMTRLSQPGMEWYAAKLAENNPDETHWSYRRFVEPGTQNFRWHQPVDYENAQNLDPGYYKRLETVLQHRPELLARFHGGKFGFTQRGKAVTPEWDDTIHLATGLQPVDGNPLVLCWDGWHQPACIITQKAWGPRGNTEWRILWSYVGEGLGIQELIGSVVKPVLQDKFRGFPLVHTGDPTIKTPDQSNTQNSALRVIQKELGGPWYSGPKDEKPRIEPLRAVLRINGCVRVDKHEAKQVWMALRGGWHRHVNRAGIVGHIIKDEHSHPGDAMAYGAAHLFPLARLWQKPGGQVVIPAARAFGSSQSRALHGVKQPQHGQQLGKVA